MEYIKFIWCMNTSSWKFNVQNAHTIIYTHILGMQSYILNGETHTHTICMTINEQNYGQKFRRYTFEMTYAAIMKKKIEQINNSVFNKINTSFIQTCMRTNYFPMQSSLCI